jgi:hypothetical protein
MFELFVGNDLVQRRGRDRFKAAATPAAADLTAEERAARKAAAIQSLAVRNRGRRAVASAGC